MACGKQNISDGRSVVDRPDTLSQSQWNFENSVVCPTTVTCFTTIMISEHHWFAESSVFQVSNRDVVSIAELKTDPLALVCRYAYKVLVEPKLGAAIHCNRRCELGRHPWRYVGEYCSSCVSIFIVLCMVQTAIKIEALVKTLNLLRVSLMSNIVRSRWSNPMWID